MTTTKGQDVTFFKDRPLMLIDGRAIRPQKASIEADIFGDKAYIDVKGQSGIHMVGEYFVKMWYRKRHWVIEAQSKDENWPDSWSR